MQLTNNLPSFRTFQFTVGDSPVTIGRDKQCSINVSEDKAFSRIQSSIIYDKEEKLWYVADGNGVKQSTNGTWVYANRSFKLEDKCQIKIGDSKIKVTFLKKSR